MYRKEGYWIVQSDEDASEWWLKSAEMGYAPCQFNIGSAYLMIGGGFMFGGLFLYTYAGKNTKK
jgi:TPR repeat protein